MNCLKENRITVAAIRSQSQTNQGLQRDDEITGSNPSRQENASQALFDEYGYSVFDIPWNLNLSYSFNYSRQD